MCPEQVRAGACIAILQLLVIVIAIHLWASLVSRCQRVFSTAAQTCRDVTLVQDLLVASLLYQHGQQLLTAVIDCFCSGILCGIFFICVLFVCHVFSALWVLHISEINLIKFSPWRVFDARACSAEIRISVLFHDILVLSIAIMSTRGTPRYLLPTVEIPSVIQRLTSLE